MLFVVVSGPPGSGKSTLAPGLARELGLPLVSKDTIKETLMTTLGAPDVEASRRLGRAAIAVLFAVAAQAPGGAVLEANFHRSEALADLQRLPGPIVEVFCRCDRAVASERYRDRAASRHPGHFDAERAANDLWHDGVAQPITGGWPVIEVDTNTAVDLDAVVHDIRVRTDGRGASTGNDER